MSGHSGNARVIPDPARTTTCIGAAPPDDAAIILNWVSRNAKPVTALADPATARAVLDAAGSLLDGTAAAPSTVRRNRAIMYNALEYAVELRLLNRNPVKAIKWKAPKTTQEIDRGCVVNHVQARRRKHSPL